MEATSARHPDSTKSRVTLGTCDIALHPRRTQPRTHRHDHNLRPNPPRFGPQARGIAFGWELGRERVVAVGELRVAAHGASPGCPPFAIAADLRELLMRARAMRAARPP